LETPILITHVLLEAVWLKAILNDMAWFGAPDVLCSTRSRAAPDDAGQRCLGTGPPMDLIRFNQTAY